MAGRWLQLGRHAVRAHPASGRGAHSAVAHTMQTASKARPPDPPRATHHRSTPLAGRAPLAAKSECWACSREAHTGVMNPPVHEASGLASGGGGEATRQRRRWAPRGRAPRQVASPPTRSHSSGNHSEKAGRRQARRLSGGRTLHTCAHGTCTLTAASTPAQRYGLFGLPVTTPTHPSRHHRNPRRERGGSAHTHAVHSRAHTPEHTQE